MQLWNEQNKTKQNKTHFLKQSLAFLPVPGRVPGTLSTQTLRVRVTRFNHGEKSRGWRVPHFSINSKYLLLPKGTRNQEPRGSQGQQGRVLSSQCLHHNTGVRKARQAEEQQAASPRIQVTTQAYVNKAERKSRVGEKVCRPDPAKQSRHRPSAQSWV